MIKTDNVNLKPKIWSPTEISGATQREKSCSTLEGYSFIAETVETLIAHFAGYVVGGIFDNLVRVHQPFGGKELPDHCSTQWNQTVYYNSAMSTPEYACGTFSSMGAYFVNRFMQYNVRACVRGGLRSIEGWVLKTCGYTDGKVPRMNYAGYSLPNDCLKAIFIGAGCDALSSFSKTGLKADPNVDNFFVSAAVSTMFDAVNHWLNFGLGRVEITGRATLKSGGTADLLNGLKDSLWNGIPQGVVGGQARLVNLPLAAGLIQPVGFVSNKLLRNSLFDRAYFRPQPVLGKDTFSDADSLLHAVVGTKKEGGSWFAEIAQRSRLHTQMGQMIRESFDNELDKRAPAVMTAYIDFLRLLIAAACNVQVFDANGFARIKELTRDTEVRKALDKWTERHPNGRDGTPRWITSGTIKSGDCVKWITGLDKHLEGVLCEAFANYLSEGGGLWPSCVPLLARLNKQAISLNTRDNEWIHFDTAGDQCDHTSPKSLAVSWRDGVFYRTTLLKEPRSDGVQLPVNEIKVSNRQVNYEEKESLEMNGQDIYLNLKENGPK